MAQTVELLTVRVGTAVFEGTGVCETHATSATLTAFRAMSQRSEVQAPAQASAAEPQTPVTKTSVAVQFVVALAEALTRAGDPEGLVQPRAARIATVYGIPEARLVVLPNVTLATAGPGAAVELDSTAPTAAELRLDQMAAIERVARLADRGAVQPDEGLRQLGAAKAMRHRFGPAGLVGGQVVITLGLCLILQPTPIVLLASALFGVLVGVMQLRARSASTLRVLLPIAAATLVSLIAFAVAPAKATEESLRALIPPLVTFLPGGLITTATLDLAAGHLISGASRLVAGTMQLVLLTLGIAIGALLAGANLDVVTNNTPINTVGAWAPWLGALVFGVGCYLHFSGPPHSLGWLLVVLLTAWAGEQLGAKLLSNQLAPFFGAFAMTPVAAWVEGRPSGPPSLATLMPAFWLLVPGAVSLIGVAQFVSSKDAAGLGNMLNALDAFILIALGIYVGNALVLYVRSRRATASAPPA
jgi:uncharacterized membrane protein YjjP (DUF1212 family)